MSEYTSFLDASTGNRIQRLTGAQAISHPPYFLQSAFTGDGKAVFFTSYRSGSAQLHLMDYPDGEIRQLTSGAAIHPYSPALSRNGMEILYVCGPFVLAVSLQTSHSRLVFDAQGAQLGEVSLDASGEWAVAAGKRNGRNALFVIHLPTGTGHEILFERTVIHPQFHPLEPEWIEFAADPAPRMFRVKRDGSAMECLYKHGNDEFVVHETFLGKTGDLVFTVWPDKLCRMDWTTRKIRTVCDFNAWHITPNQRGSKILCDTNHPDLGLFEIDATTGARGHICLTQSSNRGSQWLTSTYALAEDFARARSEAGSGALSWMETSADMVYGPQWTHPHPAYSHDERLATFASDRTGVTQIYCVDLPAD